MKTIIAVLLLSFACAFTAAAESEEMAQVDAIFTKTQKFLNESKQHVVTPGAPHDDLADFSHEPLLFIGEGVGNPKHDAKSQRGIMAIRAAELAAQRAVLEYIKGFVMVGSTMISDGMLQSDVIVSAVQGTVKGVQKVNSEYDKDTERAIVIVKLGMGGPKGFGAALYEKILNDPKVMQSIKTDKEPFKAEPVKLEIPFDGLIIDATGQNFRPALINRIFAAKGEVLYDPAKISQKVLVEQGCGEYTNSVDKAKAALATRGVKNPLVIKASGSTSSADLQVTDEDAVTIFSANQKESFMAAAKVAFVLK